MTALADDLGHPVLLSGRPARVVSLVPSITESLAATVPDLLVGATDWCTHPAALDVTRVRGTKNPDLAAIAALEPDLVVANKEENRELDVRRLREPRHPGVGDGDRDRRPGARLARPAVRRGLRRAAGLAGRGPRGVGAARGRGSSEPRGSAAVAIWRDPWMVVGRDTFTGDLLRLLGLANVFGDAADRYPATTPEEIEARRPTWCCCPTSPTCSPPPTARRRSRRRTALVSGRLLTWYGPSLVGAREALLRAHRGGAVRCLVGRPTKSPGSPR